MKFNFFIFLLVANIFISLANLPQVLHEFKNPPDRIFLLAHTDWPQDYYLYLSAVTEGKNGDWLYHTPYTTEKTSPGIYHLFYILTGKIARIFSLDAVFAYHAVRLVSLEIFILLHYLAARIFLGQRLAFWGALFGLAGTISPLGFQQKIDLENYPFGIPWWINFDALERLNSLPHHLFGQSLLLAAFLFFFYTLSHKNLYWGLVAVLSAFIGGIIFPPILLPLVFALPIAFIFKIFLSFIQKRQVLVDRFLLFLTISVSLSSIASLLVIRWQETAGFPWTNWIKGELLRWNGGLVFDKDAFFLFGILPLASLPAVLFNLKKLSFKINILIVWGILPFLFLPWANFLQIPKIRLFQPALFTPWGFLAAYSLFYVLRGKKILSYLLSAAFLVFSLSVSLTILTKRIASVTQTTYYTHADPWHLPINDYQAVRFIEKNLPTGSVVLSEIYMGNIIPAFSPITTYIGHFDQTLNINYKENQVRRFYSRQFSDLSALDFLQTNGISYVYFGRNEKKLSTGKPLNYPFLKSVYHNDDIDLFKVLTTENI